MAVAYCVPATASSDGCYSSVSISTRINADAEAFTEYSVGLRTASAPFNPHWRAVSFLSITLQATLQPYDSHCWGAHEWAGAELQLHRELASVGYLVGSSRRRFRPSWHAGNTGWQAVTSLPKQANECYAPPGITITGNASSFPRPELHVLLSRANLITKTIELPVKRAPKNHHDPPRPRRQERTSLYL